MMVSAIAEADLILVVVLISKYDEEIFSNN